MEITLLVHGQGKKTNVSMDTKWILIERKPKEKATPPSQSRHHFSSQGYIYIYICYSLAVLLVFPPLLLRAFVFRWEGGDESEFRLVLFGERIAITSL